MAKDPFVKTVPKKVYCPVHEKEETIFILEYRIGNMLYSESNGCNFCSERPECHACDKANTKVVTIPSEEKK